MKPDERALLLAIASATHPYVRDIVKGLGINPNRAAYICGKWTRKGWYNWGVNVLAGWLTEKGLEIARAEGHQ